MTKKLDVDVFLCYCTLQKAPITASSENLPDSLCSAHGRKYFFLSNRTFQVLIFKNIHITKSYVIKFWGNIWDHGKNLKDLSSQNPC